MSIIHDALKKVQNQDSAKTEPPAGTHPQSGNGWNTSTLAITTIIVVSLAVLALLGGLTKTWINGRSPSAPPRIADLVPIQPTPALDAPDPKLPTNISAPLKVEGIMDNNGKKVVLINGNIYEEGQSVGTLNITQIDINGIVVTDGTNSRNIPVKN